MAIIRRKKFTTSGHRTIDSIALIDTPEKLINFVNSQGLETIPLDVELVSKHFDINIKYVPMENDLSGILEINENSNTWTIYVNEDHHPNRQRYTIAHELGHFCLHRHLHRRFEDQTFFRGAETNKEEWQANDFASAILMPEDKFRELVRAGKSSLEDLSKEFKVSTLSVRIRAKNLGMSGHGL